MSEKTRNSIMAMFFIDQIGGFNTNFRATGVQLHRLFCLWAETHPKKATIKFIRMFPSAADGNTKTKSIFKKFLDQTLGLRKSTNHSNYFVKTKEEAECLNFELERLVKSY